MLKEYSLLTYKQFIMLLDGYRKRALKMSNYSTSKHLFHIKQALKAVNARHTIMDCISYHEASKFLVSPYLYDDDYHKLTLIRNFQLNKHNAYQNALKVIKLIMKFEPTNNRVNIDSKVFHAHNQHVYTPRITNQYIRRHLLHDNYNAKLLFKKFYNDDFKKANQSADLNSPFYATVKYTVTNLKKNINSYQKNMKGLKKIITTIENVVKSNPELRDINELSLAEETPLTTYKSCLDDTKRVLKESRSSLKRYQKMDDDVLLCNGRVATPNDIERDIHRYDDSQISVSYSELAKQDLVSLKR